MWGGEGHAMDTPSLADRRHLRRKGREAPPAFKQFFSSAYTLSHVNLSATRLPLEALRSGGCRVGGVRRGALGEGAKGKGEPANLPPTGRCSRACPSTVTSAICTWTSAAVRWALLPLPFISLT